jgi:predicted dehydrogenase
MRIGILGVGGMGNVHARQYRKMPDVEIGFYDLSAERSDVFAQRWQADPKASLEELLTWADVVDICLPTDAHLDACLRAISEGRAVFVEKPLARTYEDAESIAEAAEKANVPLGVGHVVRYFPEFRTGHDIVKNNGVGKPAAARTRRGGAAPKGSSDWFMDHS